MHEIIRKIKGLQSPEVVTVATIVLVGFAGFGLGRLSALESLREPVRIANSTAALSLSTREMPGVEYPHIEQESSLSPSGVEFRASSVQRGGQIVGSKNGTKYHFPWCAGAQRIKDENKRWFDSIAAARAAGYSPASNCKGLE